MRFALKLAGGSDSIGNSIDMQLKHALWVILGIADSMRIYLDSQLFEVKGFYHGVISAYRCIFGYIILN